MLQVPTGKAGCTEGFISASPQRQLQADAQHCASFTLLLLCCLVLSNKSMLTGWGWGGGGGIVIHNEALQALI